MPKINYLVRSSAGAIVGTHSSHRTYTHALVVRPLDGPSRVSTWCGSLDLARKASTQRQYTWNAAHVEIMPVEIEAPKSHKPAIDVAALKPEVVCADKSNCSFMDWWRLFNAHLRAEKWGEAGYRDAKDLYEEGLYPDQAADAHIKFWKA